MSDRVVVEWYPTMISDKTKEFAEKCDPNLVWKPKSERSSDMCDREKVIYELVEFYEYILVKYEEGYFDYVPAYNRGNFVERLQDFFTLLCEDFCECEIQDFSFAEFFFIVFPARTYIHTNFFIKYCILHMEKTRSLENVKEFLLVGVRFERFAFSDEYSRDIVLYYLRNDPRLKNARYISQLYYWTNILKSHGIHPEFWNLLLDHGVPTDFGLHELMPSSPVSLPHLFNIN